MNPLALIRLYRYFLASGIGKRNAKMLTWAHVTRQAIPLVLETPSGAISIRPQTTDMLMARDVLWHEEYAFHFKRQPNLIVDAGANIGAASIYFHSRFPSAKIIAIEPDPGNYKMLCANLQDIPVQAFQRAFWPNCTSLALDFSESAECAVKTVIKKSASHAQNMIACEVETITPEDLISSYGRIDILKLDIEGAEAALFSPGNNLSWLHSVNVIIIELHDRFERGCSRNFWSAVSDFPEEAVVGENICVARAGWLLEAE